MKLSLKSAWNNQKEPNISDVAFIWFDLYMKTGNVKKLFEGGVIYGGLGVPSLVTFCVIFISRYLLCCC